MAGYIGSKAVTLSTTAADVTGNAIINGDLTVKGTTLTVDSAAAQEIRLGDNDKLTFGDATGGDLQIYHDGFNSYIDDAGTGGLIVRADNFYVRKANDVENMIIGSADGAVTLYHDNATKLATTSTGVDITGTLTSDGLTVDGASSIRHSDATTNISLTPTSTGGVVNVRDSSGNSQIVLDARTTQVGIGTSSPSRQLSLYGTLPAIAFQTSTSGTAGGDGFQIQANSTDVYLWNYENTPVRFGTNGSERMQIDSSGNVGIGTSSPTHKVHISTTDTTPLSVEHSDGSDVYIKLANNADGAGNFLGASSNNLTFWTENAERMRLTSDGILSINDTTDPTAGGFAPKLHVKQGTNGVFGGFTVEGHDTDVVGGFGYNSTAQTFQIAASYRSTGGYKPLAFITSGQERMRIDGSGAVAIGDSNPTRHGQTTKTLIYNGSGTTGDFALHVGRVGTGTENQVCFSNGYGKVGSITTSGTSTAYNTSSDYRLKENVTDVTDGITRVKQLAPKRFNFIAEPDKVVDGFIAHEAQAVVPEAVTGTQDAVDVEGNPEYQGIDQSKLVPLLTAALQEAIAKIETLETEMTSVKARLDALEAE